MIIFVKILFIILQNDESFSIRIIFFGLFFKIANVSPPGPGQFQ